MPTHFYDRLVKLRDLLDEELIKRKRPGFFKISEQGEGHMFYYSSLSGEDLSTELKDQLMEQALLRFASIDPFGYVDFMISVIGKDIYII